MRDCPVRSSHSGVSFGSAGAFSGICIFQKNLFALDIANAGNDITSLPEFKEADVIHLHWVNQGMLSLKGIRKILNSGKPVVWTMHDIWPASSICHLTLGCHHYNNGCGNCKYLPQGGGKNDLSARIWKKNRNCTALEAFRS